MSVNKVLVLIVTVLAIIGIKLNSVNAIPDAGTNVSRILNSLFDSGYDKRVRPNYGGSPVEVGVTMHIISISSVSATQMEFTTDFYFRQIWKDERLSFIPESGIKQIIAGADVADRIWVPDTFFANEKVASFHMTTTPNTFLRISSSGEVYRSIRLTMTASCPMDLQYFPMDSQTCAIEIESYGFSMADIVYIWAKGHGSVGLSPNLELPQFKVVGYRPLTKIEVLSTGNYSSLVAEIELQRSSFYYIMQTYIPAILIVVMSCVSFWINRNAVTARVIIGLTTSLTIIMLWSFTNASLPKISYIKSIDNFLGFCFAMTFASLLEFATIHYLNKQLKLKEKNKSGCCDEEKCIDSENATDLRCGYSNKIFSFYRIINFDVYSRMLFPVCFVIFNLIYWHKLNNRLEHTTDMIPVS